MIKYAESGEMERFVPLILNIYNVCSHSSPEKLVLTHIRFWKWDSLSFSLKIYAGMFPKASFPLGDIPVRISDQEFGELDF